MNIQLSERLKGLPPYLFAAIDQMKTEAIAKGVDIINLGIGDPDCPTPEKIIRAMQRAVEEPKNHQYPAYEGSVKFREEVALWFKKRFSVALNPQEEILTLIGSKEGIGHIPMAFINPGDVVLMPDPGYPVYYAGTIFAGGTPYFMPLLKQNNFLPDLSAIPPSIVAKAKMIFLNYPNNPTSAVATEEYFKELVEFAIKNNIIVCHDAAYSEIFFDGERPISFLNIDGAREVGIEFHSLSKTFNMTGWRIGFAVGNSNIIEGLRKVKSNIDSGVFQAIQEAGIEALNSDELVDQIRSVYQERRDVLIPGLKNIGMEVFIPQATFYVWVSVPHGFNSIDFTKHLIKETGIITIPGRGFGAAGEGYIRLALTVEKDRFKEAIKRLERVVRG